MSLLRLRRFAGAARALIGIFRATAVIAATGAVAFAAMPPNSIRFNGSIRKIESMSATGGSGPMVVRSQLAAAELAADLGFEVALKIRNFEELQSRLAQGQTVTPEEMVERFFPTADAYAQVVDWLKQQGFTITRTDENHLAVFARGSVDRLRTALQVDFARVAVGGKEYTSAITAPAIPADLAPAVLGVHGLQPHLRLRPGAVVHPAATGSSAAPYTPAEITAVYHANSLGVSGAGQTIAIFGGAFPAPTDLAAFARTVGVTDASTRVTNVTVGDGPAAAPESGLKQEVSLDVQWASALAPGATVRVYGFNEDDVSAFDEAYQQVYSDLSSHPGMHQLSISFSIGESELDRDYLLIIAQYTATLANAGVTIFASSGDSSQIIDHLTQVSSPACDPSVTGVGGTTLIADSSGNVSSETAWSGTGGGYSVVFARPAWQTWSGLTANTPFDGRRVPDIAATADPDQGAIVIVNNLQLVIGGTSWSAPVWAAFSALINERRANNGLQPLGQLNPKLYPLIGTTAFRDITSGVSGSYAATSGYDICTGLGVPNVSVLITALGSQGATPLAILQSNDQTTTVGQGTAFAVAVQGSAPLTCQWQREPAGTSTWANLADGATYSGSATTTLIVSNATSAMSGDQFRCVVTNSSGSMTTPAIKLTVIAYGVSTIAGWPQQAGATDGIGRRARFSYPGSVRVDGSGNLYVTDAANNTIRKITPAGVVSTIGGIAGVAGSTNGGLGTATFNGPGGLALGNDGTIYVADTSNYAIRKIAPDGTVSTLAGYAGIQGTQDGTGIAARFYDPQNIAIDPTGTILYVADGKGDTVRKVTLDGTVTTIAGSPGNAGTSDGTGGLAHFNMLTGIAVDRDGYIYVADLLNHRVRKVTPTGTVTTIAGSDTKGSADGNGTSATLSAPGGLAVDRNGNVVVADSLNNNIRMIAPTGAVTTIAPLSSTAPEGVDGDFTQARFNIPADVAIDAAGIIHIADGGNNTIRRIQLNSLVAPQITFHPSSATIQTGTDASFAVSATGTDPLGYTWQIKGYSAGSGITWTALQDGSTYGGTATATLAVHGATVVLTGSDYRCVVTNNAGSAISGEAVLNVLGAPVVTGSSLTMTASNGQELHLVAPIAANGATYQWFHDGSPVTVSDSSSATLIVSPVSSASAGKYTVTVTNSFGSVTTDVATVTIGATLLANISARANCGTGDNVTIGGFVINGTGTKNVLIRAVGPTLTSQGIGSSAVLADPTIAVHDALHGNVVIASNDNWNSDTTAGNIIATTAQRVGAFALAGSDATSSAMVVTLSPGVYSFVVNGKNATSGIVLIEVYDADQYGSSATFVNIAARAYASTGDNVTIGGFVVSGTTGKRVLLRAVGPTLTTQGIGASAVLADPVIEVHDALHGNVVVATNDNWGDNSNADDIRTTGARIGATPFASNDTTSAALLTTLQPGVYSFVASGKNNTSGIVLIEVYDAD